MEVLISTGVLTILIATVMTVLYQAQHTYESQENLVSSMQQSRVAIDQISRYIRQAGNDPEETALSGLTPIQIVGAGHLRIFSDVTGSIPSTSSNSKERKGDPDGLLTSIYERIEIRHDPDADAVYLDIGYGEELLAENVSALNFTFYDQSSLETTNSAAVVKVRIEMVAETSASDLRTGKVGSVTLVSEVFVRNRAYDPFSGG